MQGMANVALSRYHEMLRIRHFVTLRILHFTDNDFYYYSFFHFHIKFTASNLVRYLM